MLFSIIVKSISYESLISQKKEYSWFLRRDKNFTS
ncbi:hypothetical protein ICK_06237 [Bacillus cereus BAG1X2-2]|nr:hypothetical protein ICK_06237 [Bacillus cereus BAG1X2-2]